MFEVLYKLSSGYGELFVFCTKDDDIMANMQRVGHYQHSLILMLYLKNDFFCSKFRSYILFNIIFILKTTFSMVQQEPDF